MQRYATLCLAAALTACATMSSAGNLLDVSVIDRITGQRIATHYHDGKLYIAGTPGEKYAVRIANRAGGIKVGKFGTAVVTPQELFGTKGRG